MKSISHWLRSLRRPKSPLISTDWGPVTESARLQAAINMRDDPELKEKVVALLSKRLGSPKLGLAEAKRRYPEAWK